MGYTLYITYESYMSGKLPYIAYKCLCRVIHHSYHFAERHPLLDIGLPDISPQGRSNNLKPGIKTRLMVMTFVVIQEMVIKLLQDSHHGWFYFLRVSLKTLIVVLIKSE